MRSVRRFSACALAVGAVALSGSPPSHASAAQDYQTLVDKAALTVQDIFLGVKPTSAVAVDLAKARAVMICPSIFRMSVVFGGSGGGCVLLARDARGSWSDPAFYTMSSGSFGIQLGIQNSQTMFFIMTDRGLQALLDSQFQFNANASANFATISTNAEAGNAGARNTDIYVAQKSQGAFAGVSIGGSKLKVNSDANRQYYKQVVGPEDILITMRVNNQGADPLRSVLMRYSKLAGVKQATSAVKASAAASDAVVSDTVPSYSASKGVGTVKSESLSPAK